MGLISRRQRCGVPVPARIGFEKRRVISMVGSNSLREIVRLDLKRAQRLVCKVHPDPIDPQFRIATPDGDYWIGITLTEKRKEGQRRLHWFQISWRGSYRRAL
jgi:hypothetical protein